MAAGIWVGRAYYANAQTVHTVANDSGRMQSIPAICKRFRSNANDSGQMQTIPPDGVWVLAGMMKTQL